eukprot:scaffold18321_cov53-Attheya_sp.AAC.2
MSRSSTTPLDAKVQEVKATLLSAAGLLNNKISAESFWIDLLEQSNRHLTAPVHNPQFDGSENLNASMVERIKDQGATIKFASLGFRRSLEATAWLTTHCPSQMSMKKLYKLKIETIGEGIAITSYKLVLNDLSFFHKIPSFSEWDERDVGWKTKLKLELQHFSQSHARTITDVFDSDSKMYTIARLGLTEYVAWANLGVGLPRFYQ